MENVNVDSENDPGSFKHPLNVPHSSTPSTSSETASPSSISRPTSHPSSSNASEKAALRFPSLPNLSESPVTTSDENLSEKVGARKVVTKSMWHSHRCQIQVSAQINSALTNKE